MSDWTLVHVITRLDLGGAQLATLYEATHGDFAAGRRVLVYGPGGLLDEEVARRGGVELVPVPALHREVRPADDLRALLQIAGVVRAARRRGRVLVHTHSSKAGIVGRWAAALGGADLVVHTAHGFGHPHHGGRLARRLFGVAERLSGRVTDGFTADSAANVHQGRGEGLFASAPARVVRCGIDVVGCTAGDGARVRRELGVGAAERLVLNLSVLKPQKDPLTYVEAAAQVAARRADVTFLLAGDGELRGALEAAAARHGLGDRLRLLGWRRDVPDLLAAADVLCLTSRWEGLPQVIFQAMAAGLPVVATAVDGTPEAVEHGETGLLCDAGDAGGIAAALLGLLDAPEERRRLGAAGRARVGEFSQERMVEALERFYGELAAEA